MNLLKDLRSRLSAKLQIADAKTAIAEAKAVLDDPELAFKSNGEARKDWEMAKAGQVPLFRTNAVWKTIVEVAVAEVIEDSPCEVVRYYRERSEDYGGCGH